MFHFISVFCYKYILFISIFYLCLVSNILLFRHFFSRNENVSLPIGLVFLILYVSGINAALRMKLLF